MDDKIIIPGIDVEQVEMFTDPETGAQKEGRLARFDLIPVRPLWLLAEHYGRGAKKYADRNWEKGYPWSWSYAAMDRHMKLFWAGENVDPATGGLHTIAVAWHAFALTEYAFTHPEKDNRASIVELQR